MKLETLKANLFSTTDGVVACKAIDRLAKLAEKGSEEAKLVLAAYVQEGTIWHIREYACARLASAIKAPHARFAAAQARPGCRSAGTYGISPFSNATSCASRGASRMSIKNPFTSSIHTRGLSSRRLGSVQLGSS
jgi:hypothetical protein